MSDINCALGISQLRKIKSFLNKRKRIYRKYLNELKKFNSNLVIPEYSKDIKPSYHLFTINILFNNLKKTKDDFMHYMLKHKIITQQHYIPIYKFSIFDKSVNFYSGSDRYYKNAISLPIYANLDLKRQEKIIKIIKNYFKSFIKR